MQSKLDVKFPWFGSSPPEKQLDRALHTLSRALEKNRTSTEIWLFYLRLYEKRKSPDIVDLCSQGLKHAPSYEMYWRYIELLSYPAKKEEVCEEMKRWLCTGLYQAVNARALQN